MTAISTPRYVVDRARRRLTPTLNNIPGMGLVERKVRDQGYGPVRGS